MDVVVSVKPKFVRQMERHLKKYEYRKLMFKREVERVFVYETKPTMKIVGYFEYSGYLRGKPEDIWQKTKLYAGIKKDFFDKYFEGRQHACAIKIPEYISLSIPIEPKKIIPGFVAPQSFLYLEDIDLLKECEQ